MQTGLAIYDSLALYLYATGKRGQEAIGIQPNDLCSNNILHIPRLVAGMEELEHEELIPLDGPEHREDAPLSYFNQYWTTTRNMYGKARVAR